MSKRQSGLGKPKLVKFSTSQEQVYGNNGDQALPLDRPFAENVLHCQIKIGEEESKRLKKLKNQKTCSDEENIQNKILENCCALYNAGGGVLEMPIANFKELDAPQCDLDTFWQTVEPRLKTLIEPLSYADVYDRKFDGNSGKVRLFIKRMPNHLCTLKSNLFLPSDSGNYGASYTEARNVLQREMLSNVEVPPYNLVNSDEKFVYGAKISFHESKQIQLKHYKSSGNILASNKHEQCDTIRKAVSSFANADGGAIILGVTNKGKAEGQTLEEDSKEAIEERVNTLINKMHWSVKPVKGKHWDIKFFPLEGKDNYYVMVIYVASVSGGVFAKCPESFEFRPCEESSEGQIHRLSFDEWQHRMFGGSDFHPESKGVGALISRFNQVSLGAPRQLLTIERGVKDIRHAFFEVKDDWPVSPGGALSKLPSAATTVIRQIQGIVKKGGSRGLVLFSRSWLRNVGSGDRPSGLICDLLLVSQDMGGLHLVTLCEPGSEKNVNHYSLETARDLKISLVLEGGCEEKFYIYSHVVPCSSTANIDGPHANMLYPEPYDTGCSPEKLNKILEALVIVLAKVPSTLTSSLGVSFMNLLTPLQYQLVHEEIDENRELWIKGPAGSGKTLVAIEFMRELRRRDEQLKEDEILYVCENKGLREQVRRAGVCQCVCRKSFMTNEFPEVKHVIMDEVQNFRDEDGYWLQKARRLVRAPSDDPDKDPGYLWLFIDNSQLNHTLGTGIPNKNQQIPNFRLKKVIRNSKRIYDYSKIFLTDKAGSKIVLGHDFRGDEVKHETYSGGQQSQLSCLRRVLKSLFTEGYSEGDIAVLYGKGDCIPSDLPVEVVTAERNNSDYLVVSTLRMYSGLERPAVVIVNLNESLPYGSLPNRSNYCAVTRAMVKLVIIEQK